MIVAIDGPAGVGKSTLAKAIAIKSDFFYLNSGNLYRAITWKGLQKGLEPGQEAEYITTARNLDVKIIGNGLLINGEHIDDKLRTDKVDGAVAQVSAIPRVREIVNGIMHESVAGIDCVVEGRDISTVVFPDAELKVYLDAAVEIRAKRRYKENLSGLSLEEIKKSLIKRDKIDTSKKTGNLKIAEDAFYLDTSHLTIDQVCDKVLVKIYERKQESGE